MKEKIKKKIKETSTTLYGIGIVIHDGVRLYLKKRKEMLEKQRGRNGFDWARRIFRARKRAAWLFKNAETF